MSSGLDGRHSSITHTISVEEILYHRETGDRGGRMRVIMINDSEMTGNCQMSDREEDRGRKLLVLNTVVNLKQI